MCRSERAIAGLATAFEHKENNFLANTETRAIIDGLSVDQSLVELAGLTRRGDGTGAKIAERGADFIGRIRSPSIGEAPARPARTGKPRGGRVFGRRRPGSVGLSGRVVDIRDRAAKMPGDGSAADSPMRFGRKWRLAGRGDCKPAACDPQSAVRCEPAGKPEMAPERLEKIEIALGNGAPSP